MKGRLRKQEREHEVSFSRQVAAAHFLSGCHTKIGRARISYNKELLDEDRSNRRIQAAIRVAKIAAQSDGQALGASCATNRTVHGRYRRASKHGIN
jgi:hypothetical protein